MKTVSSGEYLDPKGMRMESGEGSTMRNFIVYTDHLIITLIASIRLRLVGYVDRIQEGRNCLKILSGEPTGKRFLRGLNCT